MSAFRIFGKCMFPARAGMNRLNGKRRMLLTGYVPRTCGDEPLSKALQGLTGTCSPHVRG